MLLLIVETRSAIEAISDELSQAESLARRFHGKWMTTLMMHNVKPLSLRSCVSSLSHYGTVKWELVPSDASKHLQCGDKYLSDWDVHCFCEL